jgi:hypothetical protein
MLSSAFESLNDLVFVGFQVYTKVQLTLLFLFLQG